jgi:hypothetical protein
VFKKVSFTVFVFLILGLLLIQLCGTQAYAEESKVDCWAVIVGVSDYKSLEDLNYADDDARELAQELSPFWGSDHVKLLLDSEATYANILAAIAWLADKEDANDIVLLSFSGHGDPRGYIAPYDAYYAETWIASGELRNRLAALESGKTVIILQTCFAGLYEANLSGSGRVVLMSSRSDEESWETSALGNSFFGYYILEAFRNFTDADANGDYELSVEEIFRYAAPKTESYSTERFNQQWITNIQHPLESDSYSGELSLLVKFIFKTVPLGLRPGIVLDGVKQQSLAPELTAAPGSTHNLEMPSIIEIGKGTRYVFTSWDDGDTSASRTISRPGAYSANYKTQYQLTINSAYGQPEGADWYDSDSTANISVASVEEGTTRHIFTGWSGDFTGEAETASVIMDSPKTITANWRTDYLLTMESAYGQPEGAGWYASGSSATISVAPVQGIIIRHIFTGWSGDFTATAAATSVTMNSPKAITANWRTDYIQLYILIAGVTGIIVLAGAILTMVRRSQRKNPPSNLSQLV